jgi:hypothetical protein
MSTFLALLAALPVAGLLVSLAVGWLATSHMVYSSGDPCPGWLLRACATTDRILLGQAIVYSGLARRLMLVREFTCGLMNLRVTESEAVEGAGSAVQTASRSMAMSLMGQAMRIMSTASRVQSRMYGHVAREIAQQHGPFAPTPRERPSELSVRDRPSAATSPFADRLAALGRPASEAVRNELAPEGRRADGGLRPRARSAPPSEAKVSALSDSAAASLPVGEAAEPSPQGEDDSDPQRAPWEESSTIPAQAPAPLPTVAVPAPLDIDGFLATQQ